MIHSQELEKQVLSGLVQHQGLWGQISSFLNAADFYSEDSTVHRSIFLLCKHALDNTEELDEILLIDRLRQLNVSFPDAIDLDDYVRNFFFFPVSEAAFLTSIKELKKYSVRREIQKSCKEVNDFVKKAGPTITYLEIVSEADKIYNKTLSKFEAGGKVFNNLFADAPNIIEERGNNPITEFGLMGPHPTINNIYGSLLRPGNITVICARTGVGKTAFAMDFSTKVAAHYNVPVLHFDNGEMSEEELVFRQVSAMTRLPLWLFETGKWRSSGYGTLSAEDVVKRVRSTWPKLKAMRFFYENVSGMTPEEMVGLLTRFYYSEIGRGNPLIFSFDYIKMDFSSKNQSDFWAKIAYMMDQFKQTVHRKLAFDGKPCVSMFTAIQSNRMGITSNRDSANIVDDESVVGLSDHVTQFCSHMFLLRKKVLDEIATEGEAFGTHKLINLKARHLGKDIEGALTPVEMPDGTKKNNFINLEIKNFGVSDKGDLRDIVKNMDNASIRVSDNESEGLPDSLR